MGGEGKSGQSRYAEDGVNIPVGDALSAIAGNMCRESYGNSSFVEVTDLSQGIFRGPRGFTLKNLPERYLLTGSADGMGTRPIVFAASGNLTGCPNSLVAMTAMDITRYGGLPLILLNILDVKSLGKDVSSESFRMFKEAFLALGELASDHNYVVLDGEIAELSECIGSEDPSSPAQFNWCGVMLGVYYESKMILGNTLKVGQKIIAFRDKVRDNGVSSIRKALKMNFGDKWYSNSEAATAIEAACAPSALYDRMFNCANGWFDSAKINDKVNIHLIAHLSGGAFKSKLGEDLLKPQGLSAVFSDLFQPAEIMQSCKDWRSMSHEEAYSTWNGGQGAVAVVDNSNVEYMLNLSGVYGIEAQVAGEIVPQNDNFTVAIKSQFEGGGWIYY
jgi:phosphoribosylaminoimidazole (AIR) synthetase